MNATERRKRFRAILAGDELVYAPQSGIQFQLAWQKTWASR
jgi:hypothetical protein